MQYLGVVALLGLAAVYCGLFLLLRCCASLGAGRAGVCCACAGARRAPQQPLARLNWLLPEAKRSSAYPSVLG
jgi:hypothetical protein